MASGGSVSVLSYRTHVSCAADRFGPSATTPATSASNKPAPASQRRFLPFIGRPSFRRNPLRSSEDIAHAGRPLQPASNAPPQLVVVLSFSALGLGCQSIIVNI